MWLIQIFFIQLSNVSIHFMLRFPFYTPWKHKKAPGFLTFSGGIEREYWLKMLKKMLLKSSRGLSITPENKKPCFFTFSGGLERPKIGEKLLLKFLRGRPITPENIRKPGVFFDVFRWYTKGMLAQNGWKVITKVFKRAFYNPRKYKKPAGFLTFSGVIKREYWPEMGEKILLKSFKRTL